MDGSASTFSPIIIHLLERERDRVITQDWSSFSSIQRSLAKETLFLLLRCNDLKTQEYMETSFGKSSLAEMKHLSGDYQELTAYHHFQKSFQNKSENGLLSVEEMVKTVLANEYDNSNTFILTALSAIEEDEVISALFSYLTIDENNILTQNIMYLFKYLQTNISFRVIHHHHHSSSLSLTLIIIHHYHHNWFVHISIHFFNSTLQ